MLAGGELPLLRSELAIVLIHIVDGDRGGGDGLLIVIGEGDVRRVRAHFIHRHRVLAGADEGVIGRDPGRIRRHAVGARVQGALLSGELAVVLIHVMDGDGGRARSG